ncbi:MAG: ArnT family glycosyltransferase [Thermoanaerobaculia bacterium]
MISRRTLLVLSAVCLLTALISPWERELFVGDETKYAQVVREMATGGSLLVPVLNGEPYSHKPPLHFWTLLATTALLGRYSIWPYVLPSWIAAALLLALIEHEGRRLFGAQAAAIATFAAAAFAMIWGGAQTARMDLAFTLLISASAFAMYAFLRDGAPRMLYLAAALCGVAVLMKGPAAFLVIGALLLFERLRGRRLSRGPWAGAIAVMAVIPLLWLAPALRSGGGAYARELLVTQNIGRAINAWVHREPPWFYLLHAPITFMPWFAAGLAAIIAAIRRRDAAGREEALFCMSWFFAVLVPFSLMSSKLDVYMVPAMVPVALLIGWLVAAPARDRWSSFAHRGNLATIAIFGLLWATAAIVVPRLVNTKDEIRILIDGGAQWLFVFGALVAFAGLVVALRGDLARSTVVLGVVAVVPVVVFGALFMGETADIGSSRPLVEVLERQGVPGDEIALYFCPHLWSRDMPRDFEKVRHIDPDELSRPGTRLPMIIATRVARAPDLGPVLQHYTPVEHFRLRGRDHVLYRRR